MGSPLGPILADILRKRHLDDILIFAKDENQIKATLGAFNALHSNIKFTCELEENNMIAFLDVNIIRRPDGTIERFVHRKPTWTGQYLNFTSISPIAYKRSLVRGLFHRVRQICTTDKLSEGEKYLTNVLISNGYPEAFIKRHSSPPKTREPSFDVPLKRVYLTLQFKGDDVLKLMSRCGPEEDLHCSQIGIAESNQQSPSSCY